MGACSGKDAAKDPDKAPYGDETAEKKDKGKKKKAPPKPPPPQPKGAAEVPGDEIEKDEGGREDAKKSGAADSDPAPGQAADGDTKGVPVVVADVNDNKPTKDGSKKDKKDKDRKGSGSSSSSSSSDSSDSGSSDGEKKDKKKKKKKKKDDGKDITDVKLEIKEEGDDDKSKIEKKEEATVETPKSAFLTSNTPPDRPAYTPKRPTFQLPSWYKPSTGATPPASTFRDTTTTFKSTTTTSSSSEKKSDGDIDPDSIIENIKSKSEKSPAPLPPARTSSSVVESKTEVVTTTTSEGDEKEAEVIIKEKTVETVTVTQSVTGELTETTEPEEAVDEERKSLEASAEAVTITEEDEGIKTTTMTSTSENEDGGTVTRTTVITKTTTTEDEPQEASEEQEPEPVVNGEAPAEEAPAAEDSVVSEETVSEGVVEQVEEVVVTKTITTEEESPEKVQELNDAQPIDAHVIISNGSAQPEDKTEADEPASPKIEPEVQQELEPDPEPEPDPEEQESPPSLLVHVFNAKKALNELLPNFVASNNSIRETHKFNARAKLMNALDKWFSGADKDKENFSRAVAVTGKPELGKTCLAGELCTKYSPQLAGYHFFQYNNANLDHNDPRMVIQALAHWMCDTFANYANMLPKVEKVEDICTHGKVHELFEALIAKPLSSPAFQHSQDEPMLIILDALDECDFSSRDSLLETLNKFNELTPEWLYLLVTARDDNQILDKLDTFKCFEMKATQDSMLDIKKFLREPMSPYMDRISLDGGVTQLAKKANGSLLCASIYKSQLNAFPEDKGIALREIDGLFAAGITGVLQETCEQFKNWLSENAPRKEAQVLYNTILGALILVREPIHMDFIQYCGSVNPEDVIHQLKHILAQDGPRVALRHQSVGEWLMSGQEAGENSVDLPTARDYLARFCLTWLRHVIGEGESVGSMNPQLTAYALKHSIAHFTDVPKQQDNVANLLCSLTYLQEKLKLADVEAPHIMKDYKHEHHRLGSEKLVTLEDYMRKHPKLVEQTKSYYKFVQQRIADIKQCPDFLLQVAANYPTVQRIQQNARVEIADKPWIENLTAVADTDCTKKQVVGQICRVDIAPDGKTLALVTKDDDYNVKVHLVNTASGEEKVPAVDIKSLPDRVGLAAKFFPDGANVFVGSLTNFVNTKGAVTSSGYDLSSIQMKEKFSIECCDISSKYVACGVTTFPFGGRSLHMVVFDQKSKKCTQALEVLKFRFGGSAQFGIRCCAISANETLLCTAVKQTNKAELKITLWNTSKWSQTQAVDINNDQIMKCRFVSDNTLLFSGSMRSQLTEDESIQKAMMWNFKDSEQQPQELDPRELGSLFHFNKGKTSMTRWLSSSGSASHMVWDRVGVTQQPSTIYSIRGLPPAMDVLAFGSLVVYVHSDQIVIYNTSDMELSNEGQKSPGPTCVQDVSAKSISFLPRSDTGLVSHNSIHSFTDGISISMLGALQEDMSLTPTVFENIDVNTNAIGRMTQNTHKYFRGSNASNLICSCTSDSNLVLMNTGNDIQIWDRGTNNVSDLPRFDELSERFQSELQDQTGLMHVVSPKDSLVAVVYNQLPELIYLYDVRSKKMVRMLSSSSAVTDFTVMPSTGFVVSYHKATSNTIVVWNQRNGQRVNEESMHIAYARTSPASDRLALSSRPAGKEVAIVLRNSDSRFRVTLDIPSTWLPGSSDSDLDFSPDGTILIGVSVDTGICRVWNAGNGEVLRDLDVPFTRPAEIVGMLNNTHVVFHDETLLVVDVASGKLIAMLPLEDNLERNTSPRGLRISPRGSVIIGANSHGQLHVFQCHNFLAIKRKTTLQRMKSISK